MKDGPARRLVKLLARLRYATDLGFTRAVLRASGEPPFFLAGTCNACGRCCEHPSMRVFPILLRLRTSRAAIVSWHRIVNGFALEEIDTRDGTLVFRCAHFDPETRRCDSYASRPGMCRDYPRNQLSSPDPDFFPECGFRAVHRRADQFRRALDRYRLDPEQRARLEEKLHLAPPPDGRPHGDRCAEKQDDIQEFGQDRARK